MWVSSLIETTGSDVIPIDGKEDSSTQWFSFNAAGIEHFNALAVEVASGMAEGICKWDGKNGSVETICWFQKTILWKPWYACAPLKSTRYRNLLNDKTNIFLPTDTTNTAEKIPSGRDFIEYEIVVRFQSKSFVQTIDK